MKSQLQQGFAIDPKTDEVNLTGLGEAACLNFDLYGPAPDYEIPEILFEIAVEVAEWWEALPPSD